MDRLGTNSLVQLGHGINQMQATITCKTSSIAVDMACNKELTKNARYGFNSGCHWKHLCGRRDLAETINKIGYL
jgi:cyanophycin synthetase